jgi:hypothetical protein
LITARNKICLFLISSIGGSTPVDFLKSDYDIDDDYDKDHKKYNKYNNNNNIAIIIYALNRQ